MKDKNIIQIFDTTLRDGEQSPGASLNTDEKMQVARQLAKLKVDIIEAGFPIASPGDFEAVRMIATEIEGPIIAGLARAKKVDIDRAWEAVKVSAKPRIHTFIATSPIHMERKLKMKPEEVLKAAVEAVQLAKSYTEDVEFSPEDAGRTEHQFLFEVVEAVIEAGATVVNIPDTVGYQTPLEFGKLIADIKEKVPNIDKAIISVHCHNDLGLAVANSLAAVANGAGQIECTINGLGERAGNAALEEVVMALKTREDFFDKKTNIDTKEIYRASRLVSNLTGIVVQPNKAVVGSNAFAHEAGIHQHGVLSDKRTYEIMDVEAVGVGESKLVLGKHSGRHAFAARLEEMGYSLDAEKLNRAFEHFKVLADKKKEIFDRDLEVLLEDEIFTIPETYTLEYIHVSSGTTLVPMATVKLKKGEEILQDASNGDGPVDAAYRAIDRITGIPTTLIEYSIQAITRGKDAQGEVVVKIRDNGNTFTGKGVSTDIIEASAKGYVNAINKMLHRRSKS